MCRRWPLDEWEAEQPPWFTDSNIDFQNRIAKYAPAEALPHTLLNRLLSEARYGVGTETRLDESREALVEMMKDHRRDVKARAQALRAKRVKQLWIWSAALGFSYVDLVGTVFVGMEYWAVGGEDGRHAARVTFGMIAGSLAVQAFLVNASGSCIARPQVE